MTEEAKQTDIVDQTDAYEAVSAFRAMKNSLFWITLICLIILQGLFWLEYTGRIDKSDYPETAKEAPTVPNAPAPDQVEPESIIEKQAKLATQDNTSDQEDAGVIEPARTVAVEPEVKSDNAEAKPAKKFKVFSPKPQQVVCIIKICNFILIVSATLYTLILLICVKISLAGRLGGLRHISKAFIRSLFAYVLILPWQSFLPGIIAGAIYTPGELLYVPVTGSEASMFAELLYYARFVGLGTVAILLIVFAQFSSMRWAKASLRRMGIAH